MPLLFVYGSLKEGYPNFHVNGGCRVGDAWHTVEPHPFWLIGGRLPCLFLQPGEGRVVEGQLFEVDAAQLARMDRLERTGEPGGYARMSIRVQPQAASAGADPATAVREAWVYVQDPALLASPGPHVGPLERYTLEHAAALRW